MIIFASEIKKNVMIIGRKTEQERLLHAYDSEYSRLACTP